MATIVQPYNPWRENLAVTILGNVLGDLWSQHRQNEQNKKANAFRGQLMQDIQAQTAAQAPVSLSQQNLPEGYDSDGWTTSFHKTYTPLTAFDFGTAGIGGSTRLPTADEVQRLGTNLASTPRFAMLNPDTIQGFISQVTQQNEQQRLKDLQNEAIYHFMNAGSFDDKMNALTAGMINGVVPADTQRNYGSYAQWRQQPFTFGSFKAGDRIYPFINNQNTGETSFQNAIPIGVPPEALLRAQTQQYIAEQNNATQRYGYDVNADSQRYVTDQNSATTRYGYDVNADVQRERNAQTYDLGKGNNEVSTVGKIMEGLDNEEKSLTKQLEVAYNKHINALTEEEHYATQEEFDRINGELQKVRQKRKELMQYIMPQRNQSSQSQVVAPTVLGAKETSQPQSQAQPQTQTTALPATSVPMVLGTFGQDIRPVIPTQNDTVPTDLSGNISDDVQVARSNALSADVKPNAPSQPQKLIIRGDDLPAAMQYNPERDNDIPKENIITRKQLGKIIAQIMANNPKETAHMTPLLIAYQLFKYKGIRIKDLKD